MGKTALLLEMADIALDSGFVAVRTTCGNGMLENIIDQLQVVGAPFVANKKAPIRGFSAGALGFSFGLTFTDEARVSYGFRTKLEMLCDRLEESGRGVVILVDEIVPSLDATKQLATAFQELVGSGKNIALVMAGLPAVVSEVLEEATLTFLNRATKVSLGPVSLGAIRAYLSTALERSKRIIDADVLDGATAATEGFPYLLQLVGYYLVSYSADGERITEETLSLAKRASYEDLDENVFKAMLRPLSDADVAFLLAMSVDAGVTKTGDLSSRLGVSQGHVQSYRRRLLDAGVIYAPRRGEVEFVIPRLADYLRRMRRAE